MTDHISFTEDDTVERIFFIEGDWKYQLYKAYNLQLGPEFQPSVPIDTPFIKLSSQGVLSILKGYCWDGPSGPMIDTPTAMRGSLVHDALYQLMRMELLPHSCKAGADKVFYELCREDGMGWFRARYAYRGVTIGGNPSTDPKNRKVILTAP